MKKLISVLLCAVFTFFSCGCTVKDKDENLLKIGLTAAGYGREWLDVLVEKFVEENPDVKVVMDTDPKYQDKVPTMIQTGKNLPDLIICLELKWHVWVPQNKLAPLDDVYADVDDTGLSMEQRMLKNVRDYGVDYDRDGTKHYYAIPWNDGASGLVYNTTMLREYNLQLPETVDELIALCGQIKAKSHGQVMPFVFSGKQPEYWHSISYAWWAQYDGVESYRNFWKFENENGFLSEGRKKSLEALERLNIAENSLNDSMGADHTQSQIDFLNGKALMIPNGSWLYSEMEKSMPAGFSMKIMPTPYIDNNHRIKTNWTNSGDQMIVPAEADNVPLAKKFLKFMNREENLQLYTKYTQAVHPFQYNLDAVYPELTDFGKSGVDIWKNSENLYAFSSSPLFNFSIVETWPLYDPIARILSGSGKVSDMWQEITNYVHNEWQGWLDQAAAL